MKEVSVAGLVIVFVGAFAFGLWGCPQYSVYSQRMEGESQLAHAEYSKKVQVQDALGKLEAAKSLAQAEVERAKGVAQANLIIGDSLKNNEGYLRWLYIEGLKEKTGQEVIYVPTEAGLPILEAGKRK
jgi:regulator of protease activity HflC (stomatin/prohibitin superfamily)